MNHRIRNTVAAFAVTLAAVAGSVLSSPAQAAPASRPKPAVAATTWESSWHYANVGSTSTSVYNCSNRYDGQITMSVKYQYQYEAGDHSNYRWRPDDVYDIKLDNDSDQWIRMDYTNIYNSIVWTRGTKKVGGTYDVSSYKNPSVVWVAPRDQDTRFSVDSPARWHREDGVTDSDPSPYGSPVEKASDPYMEATWTAHAANGSVTICGSALVTIVRPSL